MFGVALLIASSFYIFRGELRLRKMASDEGMLAQTIVAGETPAGFSDDEMIPAEERSS